MVLSALLDTRRPSRAAPYRQVIGDRRSLVSFVSVAEIRYGAIKNTWGELRLRALDKDLTAFTVVRPDAQLIVECARLWAACEVRGHALSQKATKPIVGSRSRRCDSAFRS
jgi:predicted nucleic acid-binding protein